MRGQWVGEDWRVIHAMYKDTCGFNLVGDALARFGTMSTRVFEPFLPG